MRRHIRILAAVLAVLCLTGTFGAAFAEDTGMEKVAVLVVGSAFEDPYNGALTEGCEKFCSENGYAFQVFELDAESETDRFILMDRAIEEGYSILVFPGYLFMQEIFETAPQHKDVKFISMDVSREEYMGQQGFSEECLENVYSVAFRDEIAAFLTGYAAVKMGYRKLGFLGAGPIPYILRSGIGFVQGADEAAEELGLTDVEMQYGYTPSFFSTPEAKTVSDLWFSGGTEVIFGCGSDYYGAVAEVAQWYDGRVIDVETDRIEEISEAYGEGTCITSAYKDTGLAVRSILGEILLQGGWNALKGKTDLVGIVSPDPDENPVKLPDATAFNASFSKEDYGRIVEKLYSGETEVSRDITKAPSDFAEHITILEDINY